MPEIVDIEQSQQNTHMRTSKSAVWSPTKAELLGELVRDNMFDFEAVASAMQAAGHDLDATQCRLKFAQQHDESSVVDEGDGPPPLEEVDDMDDLSSPKPQTATTWMTGRLSPTIESAAPVPPSSRPFDYSRFNHIGDEEELEEMKEIAAKQQKAAAKATEDVVGDIRAERESLAASIAQRGDRKEATKLQKAKDEKARLQSFERAQRLQKEDDDRRAAMTPEEKERQYRIDESLKIFRAQRAARKEQEAQQEQSSIVEVRESEEAEQLAAMTEAEEDKILLAKMNALESRQQEQRAQEQRNEAEEVEEEEEELAAPAPAAPAVPAVPAAPAAPAIPATPATPAATTIPMSNLNSDQVASLTEFFLAARAADQAEANVVTDPAAGTVADNTAGDEDDGSFAGFDALFDELKEMDEAEQTRQNEFNIEAELATMQIQEILSGKTVNAAAKKNVKKVMKKIVGATAEEKVGGASAKAGKGGKAGKKKKRKGKGKKSANADALQKNEKEMTIDYDKWSTAGQGEEMTDIAAELKDLASSVQEMGVPANLTGSERQAVVAKESVTEENLEITDGMTVNEMMRVIELREIQHKEKRNKIFEDVLGSLGGPLDEAIAKAEAAGLAVGAASS